MKNIVIAVIVTAIISLVIGFSTGFIAGLSTSKLGEEFIAGVFAAEEEADLSTTRKLSRERFRLEYPVNWELDADLEEYDPDLYFSIDSPGGSYVIFEITPAETSASDRLDSAVDYFQRIHKLTRQVEFENYGPFAGRGIHLFGTFLGEEMQQRVFCYTSQELSFTITEYFDTETEELVRRGFDWIENSLEIFPAGLTEPMKPNPEDSDSSEIDQP